MTRRCPRGMVVQSIIVPFELARTLAAARRAVPVGFKRGAVDKTGQSYRFRQRSPQEFTRGSLRTIPLGTRGIKAVLGCPRHGLTPHNPGNRHPLCGPPVAMVAQQLTEPQRGTAFLLR